MEIELEFRKLTKHFGDTHAVNDLSFKVAPGRVTGFLGPNGAGKSTSLRCLTGLVSPTSGAAYIGGRLYGDLERPASVIGAALEATGFHPGRTGFDNLAVMANAAGLPLNNVSASIDQVGMTGSAKTKVGEYSLGMRQRLALAAALIGNPQVLVLDEPANGLDPEGIAWLRNFLQFRASEGCTVLVSSHVLSEVQQTVDDVVIIAKGQLVKACPLSELVAETHRHVEVISPDAARFAELLRTTTSAQRPTTLRTRNQHMLEVEGLSAAEIGKVALEHHIELHGLAEHQTDLEDVFLALTGAQR